MNNAAIYLNPEAYNTDVKQLMGRHSAGEGFLRGFLRHGDAQRFYFWNVGAQDERKLGSFVRGLEPFKQPATWIGRSNRAGLKEPGTVYLPIPHVAREAWSRRRLDSRTYSICGVTHTTATHRVMDALADMMIAPVKPWDALICTSRAVQASTEAQFEAVGDYLERQLGARRRAAPRLEMIPLGINSTEFRTTDEARRRWRDQLGIPAEAVVALYVGRFNFTSKMHPVPMALALERAALRSGRPVAWVMAGWANEKAEKVFHDATRAACPSVQYCVVDGREAETRKSIWSVGDFFISLSDNIQETFGLTPVEAMAAGLPLLVSDWDGYKDTVRHGVDGFRIPTYAPRPGLGDDLAFRHAEAWDSYDAYTGAAAQFTAVDVDAAADAALELIENADLRQRMGAAAAERARRDFDWSAIIPRYQALWADLNKRRLFERSEEAAEKLENPWRLDPFRLFANYPTEFLSAGSIVALAPGADLTAMKALKASSVIKFAAGVLPSDTELEMIIDSLANGQARVADVLVRHPEPRRFVVERGLLFLAKYGLVTVFRRRTPI